jgi:hypothetical protein
MESAESDTETGVLCHMSKTCLKHFALTHGLESMTTGVPCQFIKKTAQKAGSN